jgi:hypothetical protein
MIARSAAEAEGWKRPNASVFVKVLKSPGWVPRLRAFGERQCPQGQDGIAREPRDQEGSLHRDWAERGEDEHQHIESHKRACGQNPSTVSHDDHICSSPRRSHEIAGEKSPQAA